MNPRISVTARGAAIFLCAIVAGLVAVHIIVQIAVAVDALGAGRFANLFDVGRERNIPTLYATAAIVFAAVLVTIIGAADLSRNQVGRGYWFGLGACFCFIAFDEFVGLHERLIEPLRSAFHASGLLYYTWVIPYSLITLIFALVYIRFLLRIPRRTAVLFIIAGAMYVAGAIGVEMISGWVLESYFEGVYGERGPLYIGLQTVEESLEMFGIVVFIYGAIDYASGQTECLEIHLPGRRASAGGNSGAQL